MSTRAPEVLWTPRLVLRRPRADDAQAMFETYASDPAVTRFMVWTTHESVERAHTFLRRCDAVWNDGSAFPWIITLDGTLIGTIEVRLDGHRAEIGYALARAHWGRGFTTEAAHTVVEWALTLPSIARVWAYHDVENVASGRVLEKTGMAREGLLRAWFVPSGFGVPRDCWIYGRVKKISADPQERPATFAAAVAAPPASDAPSPESARRLETERLVLRPTRVDDADAVFGGYAQDPEVSRYTSWSPHGRIEDTRGFLQHCEEGWTRRTVYNWAIVCRHDGRLIGTTDIRFEGHRAEIGYVLERNAWGHGYATEAARAVVSWGLAQPTLHRVWAVCDVENEASARVLEKAGMKREGCLRSWARMPAFPGARDVWCYASVRGVRAA
jgi:RimJ/RimL family protein N-acetyltransferase